MTEPDLIAGQPAQSLVDEPIFLLPTGTRVQDQSFIRAAEDNAGRELTWTTHNALMNDRVKPALKVKAKWIGSPEAEEAVTKLVEDIRDRRPLSVPWVWPNPALNVIDCVLSLRRPYERVVLPRVKRFAKNCPEIITLDALRDLIRSYDTPYEFGVPELDYHSNRRMSLLLAVTERLIEQASEHADFATWAEKAERGGEVIFNVKGFGPAGFQYLRILFGAQTLKPDTHILAHVKEVTGFDVAPNDAVALLSEAATRARVAARDLDHTILVRAFGIDVHPAVGSVKLDSALGDLF